MPLTDLSIRNAAARDKAYKLSDLLAIQVNGEFWPGCIVFIHPLKRQPKPYGPQDINATRQK